MNPQDLLLELVHSIEDNDFCGVKNHCHDRKLFNMRVLGRNGLTPLMIACRQQNLDIDIIRILISSGSASNMKDYSGKTPFVHACECGNYEIAKLIYEKAGKGKNAIRFVLSGDDPLTIAVKSGNESLVRWLSSTEIIRSSRKRALLAAIDKGDFTIFKSVYDHCCSDSFFNWFNILKLSANCRNIQIEMLKLLLLKCKDIGPLELEDYAKQSFSESVSNELLNCARKKRQDLAWKDLKSAYLIRERGNALVLESTNNERLMNHPLCLVCDDVFQLICSFLLNEPLATPIRHFFEKEDGVKIWHFYDGGGHQQYHHHSWSDDEDWNFSDDDEDEVGYDY